MHMECLLIFNFMQYVYIFAHSLQSLSPDLWTPLAFGKEFGHQENDLVNCHNCVTIVGHKMKVFWDGFDKIGCKWGVLLNTGLHLSGRSVAYATICHRRFIPASVVIDVTRANANINLTETHNV